MRKLFLGLAIAILSTSSFASDDAFKAKQENMKAKMADKQSQAKSKEAVAFFKQKSECIDSAKTDADLKNCKTKFPPQKADELISKQ